MKKSTASLAVILLATVISGCATRAVREQPARLKVYSSTSLSSLTGGWGVEILSVDGKGIPTGVQYLQLAPGSHKVEYHCVARFGPRDRGGARGRGMIDFQFDAGTTYYPYAVANRLSQQDFEANETLSTGTCALAGFSSNDPNPLPPPSAGKALP